MTGSDGVVAGRGGAESGVGAARTRRWRRALAGYTANVTTYVATHVMPGRRRAASVASVAVSVPPVVVAPPVAAPRTGVEERDRRWPAHVVNAVARILVALDWAMGGGRPRRRR